MRTILLVIWGAVLISSPLRGETTNQTFYVDPKLAQSVYAESRAQAHQHRQVWTMGAMAGVTSTNNLALASDLFRTDYSEASDYLPVGALSIGRGLWTLDQAVGDIALHVGYSSYRDSVRAVSKDGIVVEDNMVLQVLPVGLRHAITYATQWENLTPQLLTEITQTWLHQVGTIDGIEVSTWRTEVGLGLGLVALADQESGFGGIVFSSVASRTQTSDKLRFTHLVGSHLML